MFVSHCTPGSSLRNGLRFSGLLLSAALVLAGVAGAQKLEHRPPPQPVPLPATDHDTGTVPPAVPTSSKPKLPAGTSLQVETLRHSRMKAGETIEGRLLHPIYAGGKLVVPENTLVRGKVTALKPDSSMRLHARLRGDFTPFHLAEVRFDELLLPSGALSLASSGATIGAPVLKLAAQAPHPKQSLAARQWEQAKKQMQAGLAFYTAPGFGDRALQMLYHQLPCHPERIPAHTAWSFELSSPLDLPDPTAIAADPEPPSSPSSAVTSGKAGMWSIHALLTQGLTSATAKTGDPVKALVVEPVFDRDGKLVVPQGSILLGKVGISKTARSFARNGKLRFSFQQIHFPEEYVGTMPGNSNQDRAVQGGLAGASTEGDQGLSLDAEGTVTPQKKSSVVAPLLLTLLAGRALHEDKDRDGPPLAVQTGVASNGFGLVGRVVGIASGNRNVAAGLGYYAAALSVYENFLRKGHDVAFTKDTRIEIETTPRAAPVMKPENQ